jgi:hypothetical protein
MVGRHAKLCHNVQRLPVGGQGCLLIRFGGDDHQAKTVGQGVLARIASHIPSRHTPRRKAVLENHQAVAAQDATGR